MSTHGRHKSATLRQAQGKLPKSGNDETYEIQMPGTKELFEIATSVIIFDRQ